MSKKKKRRAVHGLGSIPGMIPDQQPVEQPTSQVVQPSTPPSSPPAKQPVAAATTAQVTTASARPAKQQATAARKPVAKSTTPVTRPSLGGQDDLKMRQNYFARWFDAVNDFWFAPRSPKILGVIRILTGLLLLYSLAVWTIELTTFFAADGLLPQSYRQANGMYFAWSHLDWLASSPTMLLVTHCVGMLIAVLFAAGIQTRVTSVLAALIAIGYCNRSIGADFGLDQILAFLCMYCAIGNAGGAYSVDRMLAFGKSVPAPLASTTTNIAIRLIQIHLCIVYFFAAVGKLQGTSWWSGEAVWLAMASYEYQQIDMTWLANYLPLVSAMTLVSLFWELFYPALVWPRLTRPIMLLVAVFVHLGIGLCMGMVEFGLVMLVANLAFLERPSLVQE